MSINRRQFHHTVLLGGLGATLGGASMPLAAQEAAWPNSTVRFVVPFAPGGGADIAARMMAERLRTSWNGTPTIVENKPGANTIIAAETVLNAPRDSNTFLATISLTLQLPYLMQKVPFDPQADLIPVAAITVEQLVLVANPSAGIRTLPELIAAARKEPKRFAFGSYGTGSLSHLLLIEVNKTAGVDITHVPYRGAAPAVQAALSGEVAFALSNLGTVKQHIASGKLTPLAVTGDQRYRFTPEIPTLKELGFQGFDTPAWIGVFAPRGVSSAVVEKLGRDIQTAVRSPELVARLNDFGQEPGQMSTAEFQALVKRDNENAARMIRAAGVRLE